MLRAVRFVSCACAMAALPLVAVVPTDGGVWTIGGGETETLDGCHDLRAQEQWHAHAGRRCRAHGERRRGEFGRLRNGQHGRNDDRRRSLAHFAGNAHRQQSRQHAGILDRHVRRHGRGYRGERRVAYCWWRASLSGTQQHDGCKQCRPQQTLSGNSQHFRNGCRLDHRMWCVVSADGRRRIWHVRCR